MTTKQEKRIRRKLEEYCVEVGADTVREWVTDAEEKLKDTRDYHTVFATEQSAVAWYDGFCRQHGLEYHQAYDQRQEKKHWEYQRHGKSRLDIVGWNSSEPYFMLWLNRDSEPHIEIGNTLDDLWSTGTRLSVLEQKMKKIIQMRKQ